MAADGGLRPAVPVPQTSTLSRQRTPGEPSPPPPWGCFCPSYWSTSFVLLGSVLSPLEFAGGFKNNECAKAYPRAASVGTRGLRWASWAAASEAAAPADVWFSRPLEPQRRLHPRRLEGLATGLHATRLLKTQREEVVLI